MKIWVEETKKVLLLEAEKKSVTEWLLEMINHREEKVQTLSQRIELYEKKRQKEEAVYQSMGPFRRLLAAKRPEHHLAVEHMVYVKRPLQEIHEIQAEIQQIQQVYAILSQESEDLSIPRHFSAEIESKYEIYMTTRERGR